MPEAHGARANETGDLGDHFVAAPTGCPHLGRREKATSPFVDLGADRVAAQLYRILEGAEQTRIKTDLDCWHFP